MRTAGRRSGDVDGKCTLFKEESNSYQYSANRTASQRLVVVSEYDMCRAL